MSAHWASASCSAAVRLIWSCRAISILDLRSCLFRRLRPSFRYHCFLTSPLPRHPILAGTCSIRCFWRGRRSFWGKSSFRSLGWLCRTALETARARGSRWSRGQSRGRCNGKCRLGRMECTCGIVRRSLPLCGHEQIKDQRAKQSKKKWNDETIKNSKQWVCGNDWTCRVYMMVVWRWKNWETRLKKRRKRKMGFDFCCLCQLWTTKIFNTNEKGEDDTDNATRRHAWRRDCRNSAGCPAGSLLLWMPRKREKKKEKEKSCSERLSKNWHAWCIPPA